VTETTTYHIKNSYTIPAGMMGRRKRDGKHSSSNNNLIQDSEGNQENGYPVPDSKKTKINDAKEPNNVHKNILKEDIMQVITENFMEMIQDMVNQNVQQALKKFQDTKIKNTRRHRNK
jgi:hypothetical protein